MCFVGERSPGVEVALHSDQPGQILENLCAARSASVNVAQQFLAAVDSRVDRRGAVVERRANLTETCRPRERRATVVDKRALGSVLPSEVSTIVATFDEANQKACPPQAAIVTCSFEYRSGARSRSEQRFGASFRVDLHADIGELDLGAQQYATVHRGGRSTKSAVESVMRPARVPRRIERDPELAEKLTPQGIILGEEPGGASQ